MSALFYLLLLFVGGHAKPALPDPELVHRLITNSRLNEIGIVKVGRDVFNRSIVSIGTSRVACPEFTEDPR